MKPTEAINFALNNAVAPRVLVKNIEWVPTKKQWKVTVWEYDSTSSGAWGINVPYRHKIYFNEDFINRCDEFVKKGITRWTEEKS
jgi:hypothetical protein